MTNILGDAAANPVLAEVVRSGFVESRHRGTIAGLAADGTQVISVGQVDVPFFPRSANKPLQAAAMLRCGLGLDSELLALAAASHSGASCWRFESLVMQLPASRKCAARPSDGPPSIPSELGFRF